MTTGLTFDQVLLVPSESNVLPNSVDLHTTLADGVTLNVPFIAASAKTNLDTAILMAALGGMGIMPATSAPAQIAQVKLVEINRDKYPDAATDEDGRLLVAATVTSAEQGQSFADAGADVLVVPLAGDLTTDQLALISDLKAQFPVMPIMVGNVETVAEAEKVLAAGADMLLVGNRVDSDFADVTDTMAIAEVANENDVPVIMASDLQYSGDIVKAIAAGAQAVVLDELLAGDVEEVVFQTIGGLRSGMGYTGSDSLLHLLENGQFVQITDAGLTESHPHDVQITKEAPNYVER